MTRMKEELSLTDSLGRSGRLIWGPTQMVGVFCKWIRPLTRGSSKKNSGYLVIVKWSRRLPDGNVMSPRMVEWEILTPNGMSKKQVVNILTRLHRLTFDDSIKKTANILWNLHRIAQFLGNRLPIALRQNHYIQSVVKFTKTVPALGGLCDDRPRRCSS